MCIRDSLSACNRKNIENLALAGAFDSFTGIKREDFFVKNAKDETFTEVLVRYGNKYQMDKAAAANSLFGGENQVDIATPEIIPSPEMCIRDRDDPNRMLYSKQEWMKTRAEMNEVFADVPEALSNTVDICDQVEFYSIDHAPIMPTFAIPEDFGTEEGYRKKYTEKDLFDEFTQDENGNVVMSEEAAKAKIEMCIRDRYGIAFLAWRDMGAMQAVNKQM